MQRYRLDPKVLPAKAVTQVAVEMVTPEAGREESRFRAGQAMRHAKATGVEILPLPRVGEAYDFSLTSIEGKAIRSGDLKGKVVVIDCWASWCSPCMDMMPKLKSLYERHHAEGLEVLGICFDHDAKRAREALDRLGVTWSQVLVPNEETVRALWHDGADIGSLPRILVLDRRGRLQADCSPQEVEAEVAKRLKDFSQGR
jgi:thiol-disulfide isomerase/thioredoxin